MAEFILVERASCALPTCLKGPALAGQQFSFWKFDGWGVRQIESACILAVVESPRG
jgi:hypothetical protein